MAMSIYKPQIVRDPAFIEYLDRIAKYYFSSTIKQVNPMQAMINNMMGGGNKIGDQIKH